MRLGSVTPKVRLEGRQYIQYSVFDGSVEEFGLTCCTKLVSLHWCCKWWNQDCLFSLWGSVQEFFRDACVCEECEPSFTVSRLLGISIFGNSLGHDKDAASENIQEIIYLGGILMWNDAAFWGDRMEFKLIVRDWYDILTFLESESVMMFSVPLICWEYRDASILTRIKLRHRATVSRHPFFIGSKDDLCISPRELELSVKASMWDMWPSFWIVI